MSYVGLGLNILIGLVYTPWMIHSIGKDNFGLYTLAMSVISIFMFDFGLSSAVSRFLSKYLAEGLVAKIKQFLGIIFKLYFVIDVLLFFVLLGIYFFIPEIYEKLTPAEVERFKVVYVIASVFSLISFPSVPLNGILYANEKFIQMKLCELAHKLIIVATMSGCLLLGYGLYALVSVNAFAGIVTLLMKVYCVRKFTHTEVDLRYSNRKEFGEIFAYSGWSTVQAIAQRMIFNIAPSILGALSGSAEIAILGVAITIEGYTYSFANALSGLFMPRVSQLRANNADVMPLMIRVGRIQLIIIGTLVIGFILLGRQFVGLWVGPQFAGSYLCAVLLIIPSFFHLPQEIGSTLIGVDNKVRQCAYVYLAMGVINVILACLFAPRWGALGIGVSVCIAYLIRTVGLNVIFYRDLHLDLAAFYRSTFLRMAPALLTAGAAGYAVTLLPGAGWPAFLLKGALLTAAFAASLWLLALSPDEKSLFRSLLRITKT